MERFRIPSLGTASPRLALGRVVRIGLPLLAAAWLPSPGHAHGGAHEGGLRPSPDAKVAPAFDIVHSRIRTEGNTAVFHMAVSGRAGSLKPTPSGQLAGSEVFSYVWPTTLDSAVVGFEEKAGILAFAVTAHPDFDDTPLFDESGDGRADNDGELWHAHWVVLAPGPECGEGALKVVDIPEGTRPRLPKTWPGLPILIDSPGWSPRIDAQTVEVRVPFDDIAVVEAASFDGVTAALRVNASVHAPLLCVADVFKVASGDLSLPGAVNR